MTNTCIVIGGGISGLSTAYYLNKAGFRPTLVEQSTRLGGVIQTEHVHGCTLEAGPDSFLSIKPAALELIREVGLGDQIIGSNDSQRATFILKRGKLEPLPDGMMMMIPTKIMPVVRSGLLGWGAKLKMGLEYFRRPSKHEDRSVRDFLVDHYGEESVDYLAEPLLAGVYGGDPGQLSANSVLTRFVELETKYGSLTRAVLTQPRPKNGGSLFKTLKPGLGALVNALTPSLHLVHGAAEALERDGSRWRVKVNGDWIHGDAIILALRAYQAGALLEPHEPALAGLLSAIPYTSSLTLSLGYRRSDITHPLNGFGFLVPKRERKHLKACTWVHKKFDHRVPDDQVVMRCFMSGESLDQGDAALVEIARAELLAIMGVTATPSFHTVHRWPGSMAQYTVGHQRRIEEVQLRLRALPNLRVIGNFFDGIGIPDCVRLGKQAAHRSLPVTAP
ncbi:MAG: protoporphyrinogen oxidase [Bryobacteraceae bacterium]